MWVIRDSDGSESLHSLYPSWADNSDHLTVVPYVTKASYEAVVKELEQVQKQLIDANKLAARHMRAMRDNQDRLREVEAANNKYYALIQRNNIYLQSLEDVDDSPIIQVKV